MELVKSKGMVVFLVIVLSLTIISSINNKKYDDKIKSEVVATKLNQTI